MDTVITKLAAVGATLLMTTLMMGIVGYCFALQPKGSMTAAAPVKAVVMQQGLG